jgi:uncharacterized protein YdeI (YjbR/CyaY-like superfamily)
MATNAQRDAGVAFRTASELGTWLSQNHDTATELDVRIYKVASGIPSVTWTECVVECLAWGWIDSRKKSLDALSYLQRISPRRPKTSPWSQTNVKHAERLIAQDRMKPPGLAAVHAAKQDKRWEAAYSGPATMVIPEDFLAALEGDAAAKSFYQTLNRRNLYTIYYKLHSAKRPATRARRMQSILDQLGRQEKFH